MLLYTTGTWLMNYLNYDILSPSWAQIWILHDLPLVYVAIGNRGDIGSQPHDTATWPCYNGSCHYWAGPIRHETLLGCTGPDPRQCGPITQKRKINKLKVPEPLHPHFFRPPKCGFGTWARATTMTSLATPVSMLRTHIWWLGMMGLSWTLSHGVWAVKAEKFRVYGLRQVLAMQIIGHGCWAKRMVLIDSGNSSVSHNPEHCVGNPVDLLERRDPSVVVHFPNHPAKWLGAYCHDLPLRFSGC